VKLEERLAEVEMQLVELRADFEGNAPEVRKAKAKQDALSQRLAEERGKQRSRFNARREELQRTADQLANELARIDAVIADQQSRERRRPDPSPANTGSRR
jgi:capsule polysaccharide export protein KpsE/RkpR